MPIDMAKWREKYAKNAQAAASEWMENFLAASGIAAAAASEEAQRAYEEKMRDPAILKKRQRRLAGLSDEDFKRPVRQGGAGLYSRGVAAKADKAAERFRAFAEVIDRVVAGLPPRGADPEANVDARVKPIVRALYEKAREG